MDRSLSHRLVRWQLDMVGRRMARAPEHVFRERVELDLAAAVALPGEGTGNERLAVGGDADADSGEQVFPTQHAHLSGALHHRREPDLGHQRVLDVIQTVALRLRRDDGLRSGTDPCVSCRRL